MLKIPRPSNRARGFIRRRLREGRTDERMRFLVLQALLRHRTPEQIVGVLDTSPATVYRVAHLYQRGGVEALRDGRATRGRRKVNAAYLLCLARETEARPEPEDEGASNWTVQRLARRLHELTGIALHFTWVWRLLQELGFRWKRSRPVVRRCNPRRRWQWAALVRVLRRIQPGEVLLFADEADLDLNPKTGCLWVRRGQAAEIETPGRNQKRYLAAALNVDTGTMLFEELDTKASPLFLRLLRTVCRTYRYARRIHLVVDNYSIHKSRLTRAEVVRRGRVQLHFLPSYSPELNPVEHVWGALHTAITRNHRFTRMEDLLRAVRRYLQTHGPFRYASPLPFAVRRCGLVFSGSK